MYISLKKEKEESIDACRDRSQIIAKSNEKTLFIMCLSDRVLLKTAIEWMTYKQEALVSDSSKSLRLWHQHYQVLVRALLSYKLLPTFHFFSHRGKVILIQP